MKKAALLTTVILCCSTLYSLPAIAAGPVYSITQIAAPPGTVQPQRITPVAINSGGTTAGTASVFQSLEPFTFSPSGGFKLFNIPGTHDTGAQASGMNDLGQLIGTEVGPLTTAYGFLYSQGVLTPLPAQFNPAGINNSGFIAGMLNSTAHATLYSPGTSSNPNPTLTDLGTLGGSKSSAAAIGASEQITGTASIPGDTASHAFLYSGGTMTDLGTLGGTNSSGTAISSSGFVAGTSDIAGDGATHAFVARPGLNVGQVGTLMDLGALPGYTNSHAMGVNDAGQVVGAAENLDGTNVTGSSAFVTTPDGNMVDLNSLIPADSGWQLTSATAINNAGQIVGTGILNGQFGAGFLLTPLSPPTCTITGSTRPIRMLTFTVQDQFSLQSVAVGSSVNANVNIPNITPGTTSPVTVTATQIDPSQNASVQLTVTNTAGVSTSCGSTISAGPAQWSGFGGVLISDVTSAANTDGRLEAFGLGSDHALWHIAQTAPGGSWGAWSSLGGGSLSGAPSIGMDSDGRLEVFAVSSDSILWHIAQSGPGSWSQSALQTVAAGVQGRVAVVRNSAGLLQVFARALDDSVVFTTQVAQGSLDWQPVSELGGVITNNPAAAMDQGGTVRVFATGTDQLLWSAGLTSGGEILPWTLSSSSDEPITGDLAVVSLNPPLYIFARAADGSLLAKTYVGGLFSPWTSLGGRMIGNPAAAVNSDGRVEAFVIGTDNALWHISESTPGGSQWSDWGSLGGYLPGDGVAPITGTTAIGNVFAIGGDQGLWDISQSVPGYWN